MDFTCSPCSRRTKRGEQTDERAEINSCLYIISRLLKPYESGIQTERAPTMDLSLDKHSPLPPHAQIQEKIKLALLLGRLRPGDTLPSIREVEKETGISRNVVRKAYLELQTLGV